ncbi:MAG: hydrogenase [Myxococcales bacterium]|jgi:hydrogenase-4 component E
MTAYADLMLFAVLLLGVYVLATSRLGAAIRAVAVQGGILALLPIALASRVSWDVLLHVGALAFGTLLLKAVLIPGLLLRAMRTANVRREVEPFISLHTSVLIAAVMVGVAFWMGSVLTLPRPAPATLLVPVALATLLLGFLVIVTRRKAITQVLGYLMLENGVYVFGQCLAREMPFVVELGILLDVLVGVFVMGIAIHHISREFDNIDTDALSTLKD